MSSRRKSVTIWALVGLLGAFLIAWGIGSRGKKGSIVLAQQDNWATPTSQRLGIRLLETRDPSGPPAYPVTAGDLLFFSNAGTSYAAKNTKNSVVVINAKTKKPIAMSDLDPVYTEKYASHGIGVSPDGKYIYLPSIASIAGPERATPDSVLILDARTLKIYQILAAGGPPHHAKVFRDGAGKQLVLIEHFGWNTPFSTGKTPLGRSRSERCSSPPRRRWRRAYMRRKHPRDYLAAQCHEFDCLSGRFL